MIPDETIKPDKPVIVLTSLMDKIDELIELQEITLEKLEAIRQK